MIKGWAHLDVCKVDIGRGGPQLSIAIFTKLRIKMV